MVNTGETLAPSRRLTFSGPVIALGLTGKSLSAVKLELMKPTRRPSISLVPETGMFLSMNAQSQKWSTLKSAVLRLSSSLPSLVGGCASRLARLICSQIILTATVQGVC